jgi:hypothetical protein
MAKISSQKARREQLFCFQGYFGSRSPFLHLGHFDVLSDLTNFVHFCVKEP